MDDLNALLLFSELNLDAIAFANSIGRVVTRNDKMKQIMNHFELVEYYAAVKRICRGMGSATEVHARVTTPLFDAPSRRVYSMESHAVNTAVRLYWIRVCPLPNCAAVRERLAMMKTMIELCPSGIALSTLESNSGATHYKYASSKFCKHEDSMGLHKVDVEDWQHWQPVIMRSLLRMEDFTTEPRRRCVGDRILWQQHNVHVALRNANELLITGMNQSVNTDKSILEAFISSSCDLSFRMNKDLRILDDSDPIAAMFKGPMWLDSYIVGSTEPLRAYLSQVSRTSHIELFMYITPHRPVLRRVWLFAVSIGSACFRIGLRFQPSSTFGFLPYLERRLELDIQSILTRGDAHLALYCVSGFRVYQDAVVSCVTPQNDHANPVWGFMNASIQSCVLVLEKADILHADSQFVASGSQLVDSWAFVISLVTRIDSDKEAFAALALVRKALANISNQKLLEPNTVGILSLQFQLALVSIAIRFSDSAALQTGWIRSMFVDVLRQMSCLMTADPMAKDRTLPIIYYLCLLWSLLAERIGHREECRTLLRVVNDELNTYAKRHPGSLLIAKLRLVRDDMASQYC